MFRPRRVTRLAAGPLLAMVLAGCGSSSSGGSPAAPNTVVIKGFAFKPSTLTVPVGTKVTFQMEDSGVQHTVTSTGSTTFKSSANLNNGQSYSVTYTKAGTYTYKCSIHPNMTGTVIVQ